jgi:carboxypeptidase-like protein
MEDIVKAKYHCSRSVFYLAIRMAWANCGGDLALFFDLKELYIAAYVTAMEDQIDAAELLPDEDARTEPSELDRLQLIDLGDICLKNWRRLERYIHTAYPVKTVQKVMLDSAGQAHYEAAFNHNWAEMVSLNNAGNTFITEHSAPLLAGMNMPAAFPGNFTTGQTNFSTKQSLFKFDESTQTPGQQAKIKAENLCYDAMMIMLADGIEVADGDPTVAHLFTWARLIKANSGPKSAGFKGDVKTGVAKKPVVGATCYIEELDLTVETDENGHFIFPAFAHGTYTIVFSMIGYKTVTLTEVEIHISTTVTKHIILIPV